MKNALLIVVVVAALLGGFLLLSNYIHTARNGGAKTEDTSATVSGTIVLVDTAPLAYDGNARITIQTATGEERIVEVPARINLCKAAGNIVDVSVLEKGDAAEAFGAVNSEGAVVPCESETHYFRATGAYVNPALGFKFVYTKDAYVLSSPPHGNEEEADFEEVYVLTGRKEYEEMQNATEPREGSPTITLSVYKNSKKQQPLAWAKENAAASNIGLALGEPKDAVVGGANAIRYTVDGLYRMDTFVVAHGGFIYLISGAYMDEDSQIRKDFEPLLNSLTFIPIP